MVDVSTIKRTSNVIVVNNVSFVGISGKNTKMVPIDFSDNESVINNCACSQYATYKNNSVVPEWGKGLNTIDREIDIITPYSKGAKYVYVLSSAFINRSTGLVQAGIGSMAGFSKSGTVYTSYIAQPRKIIKKHLPADEMVAWQNGFDAYIMELLYALEDFISAGATGAVFSYIADVGPHVLSPGNTYSYENTVINKPIAYFVYET